MHTKYVPLQALDKKAAIHSLSKLISMSILLSVSSAATAGAWVGEKGSGYIKLGYADYSANNFIGENPSFNSFNGKNTSLYVEHGIGNNFAVYGSLLYQSLDQVDIDNNASGADGFSDTELGLKYQWQADPFVLSTSFLARLPYLYDETDEFPLGDGQEAYEGKVLIGKSLNQYGYLGIEMGYRAITGEPSDEYRYLIEYGFNLNKNIYFRTKLDGVLSANNSTEQEISGSNLLITSEYDSGKLELSTGWNFDSNSALKGYGIEFTYTREIYGDNILQGNSYQLGITKVY